MQKLANLMSNMPALIWLSVSQNMNKGVIKEKYLGVDPLQDLRQWRGSRTQKIIN